MRLVRSLDNKREVRHRLHQYQPRFASIWCAARMVTGISPDATV
jgi:hypothetical protein